VAWRPPFSRRITLAFGDLDAVGVESQMVLDGFNSGDWLRTALRTRT